MDHTKWKELTAKLSNAQKWTLEDVSNADSKFYPLFWRFQDYCMNPTLATTTEEEFRLLQKVTYL